MNKSILTAVIAATLIAGFASSDAGARERGRNVQRSAHQGTVSAHRDNARFQGERERDWQRDGEGNASMNRSGSVTGAKGGTAERQGSIVRNADGSLSHQASGSGTTANGGTIESSGGICILIANTAEIAPTNAATDPTERSNFPPRMQSNMPIARIRI